jgi:hypothetical protein
MFSLSLCAQDRDTMSKTEIAKMDSIESSNLEAAQLQKTTDENRMAEVKLEQKTSTR